jgi:hypothetical protein
MRLHQINGREWGKLQLAVIQETDGTWPEHPQLCTVLSALAVHFTRVSDEVYQHAMAGYTAPLLAKLGVPPAVVLRRVVPPLSLCWSRKGCPAYQLKTCVVTSGVLPVCFLPDYPDEAVRGQLNELLRALISGAFAVLVVTDSAVV